MYDLFGKYGKVRQIRVYDLFRIYWNDVFVRGDASDTKGTAFVVYDDIYDAKTACEHLSGFNLMGRYLIVLYYQPKKGLKRSTVAAKEEEVRQLKERLQASEQ